MTEIVENYTRKNEKELYEIFSEALFKQKMFREFWERQPVLNCIIDLKGRFVKVNQHWEKVLGYTKKELEGKSFVHFIAEADKKRSEYVFNKNKNSNCELKVLQNRWISKEGKEIPVKWYPFSVNLENGIATTGIENG